MGITPGEQLSEFLRTAKEMAISRQAKDAFKDPELVRTWNAAIAELRDKPGTGYVHRLSGGAQGREVYGFELGTKGCRGVFLRNPDGTFSLLGISKDHDYKKMLGMERAERIIPLPEKPAATPPVPRVGDAHLSQKWGKHAGRGGLATALLVGAIGLASGEDALAAVDKIAPTNLTDTKSLSCQFAEAGAVIAQAALPVGGVMSSGLVGLAAGLVAGEALGRVTAPIVDHVCGR